MFTAFLLAGSSHCLPGAPWSPSAGIKNSLCRFSDGLLSLRVRLRLMMISANSTYKPFLQPLLCLHTLTHRHTLVLIPCTNSLWTFLSAHREVIHQLHVQLFMLDFIRQQFLTGALDLLLQASHLSFTASSFV